MAKGAALAALALCGLLGASLAGCGGGGVSDGATVSVYVSAPQQGSEAAAGRALCAGAEAALAKAGGMAGELRVRVVCLDASGAGGEWTLASVGADARRATADSSAVAYIGEPSAEARRQSHPILEAAGIGQVAGPTGAAAMEQVLGALEGSGDPREAVREALEGG